MLIGSARVSKADGSQSLDLQRDALRAAGVDAGHVYHDFPSGVRDDRPGLDSCVRALRTGDVLVVWKLDRLGRNLAHLVNTVQDLSARGVGLRVLTGQGAQIDTTTAAGRLVFGIFAALAEFERELDSTTQRRCAAGCGERCSRAGASESNPSTVEGSLVGRGRDDGGWRAKFCGPVGGNCKFPIRGNRKPHTLVVGGLCPAFHDVGESNSEGAGGKCTDGRRGCC